MSEEINLNDPKNQAPTGENPQSQASAKPAQGNSITGIVLLIIFIGIIGFGMYKSGVNRDEAKKELGKRNIVVSEASLLECIKKGDVENLNLLLKAGISGNVKGENDTPALILAINQNKSDLVRAFLDRNIDINVKSAAGISPLQAAAEINNFEIIKMLIEKKAAINVQDANGTSPLMIACDKSNIEIVKLLIEKGANLSLKNNKGETSMTLAKTENIKELLIKAAAAVTKPGQQNVSGAALNPIQITAIEKMSPAEAKKQLENLKIAYNDNRFVESVTKNEAEITLLFIKAGMHPNIKNSDGINTLMEAAKNGNLDIAKLLIEKGANVNSRDKNDSTPLILACEKANVDIVKLLIEKGSDINARDKKNRSALSVCVNPDIKQALLKAGAK